MEQERWVLIVDDDPDDGKIDCSDQVPGCYPDVIILDHKMPRLSGLNLLRKLKAHPEWKHIPVVMYSGAMTRPEVRQAYEAGANAYVLKPGTLEEFKEAFRNLGAFWTHTNVSPHDPALPDIGRY
jgi:CheY-like chemotaxis protein